MDQSLFQNGNFQPLASRMRPQTLDEFVGQTHLLGKDKVLSNLIEHDEISSMIFWGPPGVGKTTLARDHCSANEGTVCDIFSSHQRD